MVSEMNATQSSAEAEKAQVDAELQRLTHLVHSFQAKMSAVSLFFLFLPLSGIVKCPVLALFIRTGKVRIALLFFMSCEEWSALLKCCKTSQHDCSVGKPEAHAALCSGQLSALIP